MAGGSPGYDKLQAGSGYATDLLLADPLAAILVAGSMAAQEARPQEPRPNQRPSPKEILEKYSRGEGKLKPGDAAPDLNLKKRESDQRVRLSDFKGNKPVALIFGSYT